MGFAVKGSGNQKNKLNDPGGGSFRYKTLVLCTSSGREKREEKREGGEERKSFTECYGQPAHGGSISLK